ncbi:NAD(P)H-binding protein [Actinoplanes sp. NPDC024001]|uniref:SDR family oxidoreductase n=1 Tax=Actinoplanes sp. NPDC024001 TaxID=3154598 RepID=UPI0033DC781E
MSARRLRIVVVGGGRIGRHLVPALHAAGHDCLLATPRTGVDACSGAGLPGALAGADAVVDVTNSPFMDEVSATAFFEAATANLLDVGARAGVRHHVLTGVLGAERMPGLGYCRAKLAQERLVRASATPWTIVRSTHTFEFLEVLVQVNTEEHTVRLPPLRLRPLTAADLAAELAGVAARPGRGRTVEVAGPQEITLDELARRTARHDGTRLDVVTQPSARPFFGAQVGDRALLPGPDARHTATGPATWLAGR